MAYVYEPAFGHGLAHDPFNAIVGPRPIGWISTISAAGVYNLAPYSFFNAFNYKPPIVGFASTSWKDSVENIKATGVFGWNLVTRSLAEKMNSTSGAYPSGVDEFELAGLTPAAGRRIAAPRVGESPVTFECRLADLIQLKSADGDPVPTWLVLGEVVVVHIDEALLEDGVYQTARGEPVLRAGGPGEYFTIDQQNAFHMARPR